MVTKRHENTPLIGEITGKESFQSYEVKTKHILGFFPHMKNKRKEKTTRESRKELFKHVTSFLQNSGRFPEDIHNPQT